MPGTDVVWWCYQIFEDVLEMHTKLMGKVASCLRALCPMLWTRVSERDAWCLIMRAFIEHGGHRYPRVGSLLVDAVYCVMSLSDGRCHNRATSTRMLMHEFGWCRVLSSRMTPASLLDGWGTEPRHPF
eukprot:3172218-Rhodomonas_salina.4